MKSHENIHQLFSRTADRFGDNVAIDSAAGKLTYADLDQKSNKVAHILNKSGAERGSIIGILATDTFNVVTSILGVLKAGCVFVPLDPTFPEKRLKSMIGEVSPSWYVIESSTLGTLAALVADANSESKVVFLDSGEPTGRQYSHLVAVTSCVECLDTSRPQIPSGPDDMCSIYFTSGSTGRPKGIAGRLKGIDHFVRWEIRTLGLEEGWRVSQLTSPSFDGFLKDVFVPLCAGGVVCVPESRDLILDTPRLVGWIDSQKLNLLHCVPSVFRTLVNEAPGPECFRALKYVVMAGEPLLPSDVRKWITLFPEGPQLVNLYGPTETTVTKLFYFVRPSDQDARFIPIGKPIEGAAALIVDPKGRVCPAGAVGEIYLRTPFRSLGYYNRPDLTAEVFVQNPFNKGETDTVYKTGDFGRMLRDGNIEFLGRRDQQVKIRGVRVELGEIESRLREHHSVKDVAVIDRKDSSGNSYLAAYVVPKGPLDGPVLREHLGQFLPATMLPSMFVQMEALPRTLNGKVDRRALPEPHQLSEAGGKPHTRPRSATEEILAGIWAQALGAASIGVDDDFFSRGGHSLLAIQVISRIREAFDIEVPLRMLFELRTVARLGELVDGLRASGTNMDSRPVVPISRHNEHTLSFSQHRLWFLNRLEPDTAFYNVAAAVRLTGQLRVNAVESVFGEIARRHEVLRTHFIAPDGKPRPIVSPPGHIRLPIAALHHLGRDDGEIEAKGLSSKEGLRPFDLGQGPLMRASVLRLADEEHLLLLTMHHIISDAWSMQVLVREVAILYDSFSSGEPSPLPELPVQYGDFAAWQRERLDGDALEEQLLYWRKQLAGASCEMELETDRPRPPVPSFRGASYPFVIPADLTEKLTLLSSHESVTLFMVMLAAFFVLMKTHGARDDIIIGCNSANRNRGETEGLIGFLVNMLPIRINVSGSPSFRDLLHRTREAALGAYAHQDLPFDKLVADLLPDRNQSRLPLVQTVFNFQSAQLQIPEIPGLELKFPRGSTVPANFDITLHIEHTQLGMLGDLLYSTDLFEPSTIAQMLEHLQVILNGVVAEPDITLEELTTQLARSDRQQMVSRQQEMQEVQHRLLRTIKPRSVVGRKQEEGAGI
jgi:amino acid adenylation domain-containing protein